MSSPKAKNWDPAAKWICSISCFCLAVFSLLHVIKFGWSTITGTNNIFLGVLFLVLGVGFTLEKNWVFKTTYYAVALFFIVRVLFWFRTGQCIGFYSLILIAVLIWKNSKLKIDFKNLADKEEEWECSECGAVVAKDAVVCPKCGADVSEVEEE